MGVGVFGKLPARRDYVQHGIDPRLMQVLDPWLQRALAESRRVLGTGWLDAYLQSPIWRFWLGAGIAGRPVIGALMPSVDGVGRYFPLAVLGGFDAAVPPPELDEHADWFAAAEALMLAALSEDGSYDALLDGLSALPAPRTDPARPEGARDVPGMFAALRCTQPDEFYGTLSCWWVPSPDGGATPPRAFVRRGLPAPADYASMIAPDRQTDLAPAALGEA